MKKNIRKDHKDEDTSIARRMNEMNNRHKPAMITAVITVLVLSLTLAGCGGKAGQEQPSDTARDFTVTEYPLKVTDAAGFELNIESKPNRIVSLTLGSDEMLMGLVDKSRILALTRYADDAGISNIASDAAGIPGRASMDNLEGVLAMKPDLVILDTWADTNYVKQLRDAGISVYTFKTPSNIEEQKATIKELAYITGTGEKAGELLDWMDSILKSVGKRLEKVKPEDMLTVMDYGEMGSSGKGTNVDDIMTRAGLVNVVSRAGMEGWPAVSKENIIEFNPDIIILPSWYYDQKNSLQGMIDTLKADRSLQTVEAIRNDRLIAISNPHISAISQYVVLAVEDLAKAAYPELFE